METKIFSKKQIPEAVELLKKGELVAFPTETVYGLGALATNEKAVKAISRGTPTDKRIGSKITPIAITEPTPYALTKMNAVTIITRIAAIKGFFFPTLLVASDIAGAIPLSTKTRPNHEPNTI